MADAGVIKPDSVSFLKQVLDPFHDTQIHKPTGWPDMIAAPSVVRKVTQTVILTQPSGTGTGNWDCHIMTLPWANAMPFTAGALGLGVARKNNYLGDATTNFTNQVITLGGVQAFGVASGNGYLPVAASPIATLDLNPSMLTGASRVVGLGFEVANTTPDLYAGGQCVVYRLPEPFIEESCYEVYGGQTQFNGQVFRPAPATAAEAILIPGSRQWTAKDGCYVVVPFTSVENPPKIPGMLQPLLPAVSGAGAGNEDQVTYTSAGYNVDNQNSLLVPSLLSRTVSSGTALITQATKILPMHQCGAKFIGLAPQTTLSLTVTYFIETFPGLAEQDLLTLAAPSCQYDATALAIASACFMELPVGVPFGYNGIGEYFAMAVRAVAEVVAPVAFMLGHPEIAALAVGAGSMASTYITAAGSGGQVPKMTSNPNSGRAVMSRQNNGIRRVTPAQGRIATISGGQRQVVRSAPSQGLTYVIEQGGKKKKNKKKNKNKPNK